jgi:hypothetical protein
MQMKYDINILPTETFKIQDAKKNITDKKQKANIIKL